MRNRYVSLGAFLLFVLLPAGAHAWLSVPWSLDDIATKANVIAVGRVAEVSVAGKLPTGSGRLKMPLLQMQAKVEVLRSFSKPGSPQLVSGKPISIGYLAADPDLPGSSFGGPFFADLSVGDILAFPLSSVAPDGNAWQLIKEDDRAILMPCTSKALEDVHPSTGVGFLEREVAGDFVYGSPTDMVAVSRSDCFRDSRSSVSSIHELIAQHVKNDQSRWLSTGVAVYTAMPLQSVKGAPDPGGTRRPKISELLAELDKWDTPQAVLARNALKHAGAKNLDERIITVSIRDLMGISPWGVSVTIGANYPGHPLVAKLLRRALEQDNPSAVYVAQYTIKDKSDKLLPAAVAASVKVLQKPVPKTESGKPDWAWHNARRAACELILNYGDEKANNVLLGQIKLAQKNDRELYHSLWSACGYERTRRVIEVIRIYINDDTVAFRTIESRTVGAFDVTFADMAASRLQDITGADFGASKAKGKSDRDAAIERAKEWLKLRPASATSYNIHALRDSRSVQGGR